MSNVRALPKSVQVSEMLIREIAAGRIVDGSRLPTERQMARELGIAIGTLRKALAVLENKGLLERVQGSGNYVRAVPEINSVYTFFRIELLDGGGLPTADVLNVRRVPRPQQAAAFSSQSAHRIRRLRYLNEIPVALEEIWLDADYCETMKASDLLDSLYYFYKESLGLVISQIEDRVSVSSVPDWTPESFALKSRDTAGYVERISFDQDGRTAEYSKTWFNPVVARYTNRLR